MLPSQKPSAGDLYVIEDRPTRAPRRPGVAS